ncbi:SecD/SecF fusion protein [Arcticibacter pallidicorallinus]|uniref:Multifunctional fusion protein n=1 Tax=Arcticibacter pallidicorallinus TaxID=1259464 RepID=A0A2T0UC05_9SPHI|nr:protein translocase subunit SecDF [Arcticibacter pallidicorallinus]PRY55449.1 SecD/SecF fusion protein [Arcticibacter pallidicorallinus]
MQGKGLIKFAAIALTIGCLYSLSFTWMAKKVENDAREYAKGDPDKETAYLDSVATEPVYNLGFAKFTYQYVKEREIPLGLDLAGGMNVTMEISMVDLIKNLANHNPDATFATALKNAEARLKTSQKDIVTLFGEEFEKLSPGGKLAPIFATRENAAQVKIDASNKDVLNFLRAQATSAVERSFNILRTRIDKFGVTSPNIQMQQGTNRILIELPGVSDAQRVRKLLQGSAQLEFWETYDNQEIFGLIENINKTIAATQTTKDTTAAKPVTTAKPDSAAGKLAQLGARKDSTGGDTSGLAGTQADQARQNPLFAVLAPATYQAENGQPALRPGPVVGYAAQKDTAKVNAYLSSPAVQALIPRNLKLLWGVKPISAESKVLELYALKSSGFNGEAAMAGDVITDARSDVDQNNNPEVVMIMNAEGSRKWRQVTAAAAADPNNKKSIAIVLDNYVYSAPTVQNEISGGVSSITGQFTSNDTKDLANVLKAGRLPAPAKIVSEYVVGPSLGLESINKGLASSIIGVIVILLFMGMYYSKGGWVANAALLVNLFFLMGVMASLGAVLTLPGIAGIVLSLAMAIDANVLIYERIREEIANGKSLKVAVSEGFSKAMSSILDSNITTFLVGVILYIFGSGPILGFATTLMLGILTSLFSAIFITRLILEWMLDRKQNISFSIKATENLFKDSKFDFISGRKKFYAISSIIIIAGLVSMFTRGFSLGVDFKGGRSYFVEFDKPVKTDDVRDVLLTEFDVAPEVKTYGSSNEVKITTSFMIDDSSPETEAIVSKKLRDGLSQISPNYEIKDAQTVGPTIANDIKISAVYAVLFSILVIFLYIFIRFRRWQFGVSAIVALAHDVLVLLSIFTLFNGILPFSLDIDQAFIAAILTVMGYSINDTVVIFDRIREYINEGKGKGQSVSTVINNALNSTLSRTVVTGICVIAVLIIIFIFGGEILRGFSFAMLIGVIFGTYSSLFVATPFVVELIREKEFEDKKATKTEVHHP